MREILRSTFLLAALAVWGAGCKNGGGGHVNAITGELSAPPLDFGTLPVGANRVLALPLSAINRDVTVLSAAFSGSGGSDYAAPQAVFPLSVTQGAGATLVVSLQPTAPGPRSGTLALTYDPSGGNGQSGGNSTLALALTAQAVAADSVKLQVSPLTLPFGDVQLGQEATQNLTIHNLNPFAVTVTAGPADGGGANQFVWPAGQQLLAENQSVQLPVVFVPSQAGDFAGQFPISACPTCPVSAVQATGTGVNATLQFAPQAVDFGFVLDSQEATPARVLVGANGNTPLKVTGAAMSGGRTSVFSVSSGANLPFTFTPDAGQLLPLVLTYTPSHLAGGDFDHLVVDYTVGNSSLSAQLPVTGDVLRGGCRLVVTPSDTLDFGTVAPGASSTKQIQVVNAGGADCALQGLALAPGSDPEFALGAGGAVDGGALPVPAHGTLSQGGISATFTAPRDAYRVHRSATLTFSSTDPTHPVANVSLKGVIGSAYAVDSPWPKWQHDNANSGQSEVDTSGFDGGLSWRVSLVNAAVSALPACAATPSGGYAVNGPVLGRNGKLLVTGCDGIFYGIQAGNGGVVWQLQLQAPAPGSFTMPSVAPNGLAELSFGSLPPNLTPSGDLPDAGCIAYDLYDQIYPSCFNPTDPNNLIGCFSAPFFSAYQVDTQSAQVVAVQNAQCPGYPGQSLTVGPLPSSAPALTLNGSLLYSVAPNQFYLYPPQSVVSSFNETVVTVPVGALPAQTAATPSPAVDEANGWSYWCSAGTCLALGPNGTPQWSASLGPVDDGVDYSGDFGAPVLAQGQLVVLAWGHADGGNAAQALSLNPASGAVNWRYPLPALSAPASDLGLDAGWSTIASPAVAVDGRILVPYADGLYALALGSDAGVALSFKLGLDGGAVAPPAIGADGTIFVGTVRQGLVAVDPSRGQARWSFVPHDQSNAVAGIRSAPAVGPDGVYFTAADGTLYAVH